MTRGAEGCLTRMRMHVESVAPQGYSKRICIPQSLARSCLKQFKFRTIEY
jgi:hypothetical protein